MSPFRPEARCSRRGLTERRSEPTLRPSRGRVPRRQTAHTSISSWRAEIQPLTLTSCASRRRRCRAVPCCVSPTQPLRRMARPSCTCPLTATAGRWRMPRSLRPCCRASRLIRMKCCMQMSARARFRAFGCARTRSVLRWLRTRRCQ